MSHFGAPHVGIVIEVLDSVSFMSVEAQIENSVRRVKRHVNDVITFGRPDFSPKREHPRGHPDPPEVSIPRARAGSYADIYNVQRALEKIAGLRDYTPGVYDELTQAAYRRWQRRIGYVGADVTGTLDPRSLQRLGIETHCFRT